MKILLSAAILLCTISISAQKNSSSPVQLKKGQKLYVKMSNNSEADFGMGMPMKNISESQSVLTVTGESEDAYSMTNTVEKIKVHMEMMGQEHRYDSEKAEDHDSEMGKQMAGVIGNTYNLQVSKKTGAIKFEQNDLSAKIEDDNPFAGVLGGMGKGDDASMEGAFLVIPAGKKIGDSWSVSDSNAVSVSKHTYKLNSTTGNVANISFTSVIKVTQPIESQGNEMLLNMEVKSSGEIISNNITSLVTKKTIDTEIAGTIEVMGQSMPITAVSKQEIFFSAEN